jgi:hypothetical protein
MQYLFPSWEREHRRKKKKGKLNSEGVDKGSKGAGKKMRPRKSGEGRDPSVPVVRTSFSFTFNRIQM